MAEGTEKGRGQIGGSDGARSFSVSPTEVSAELVSRHSNRDLNALIKAVATSPDPDIESLLRLTPREQAYLMGTEDFRCLVLSQMFRCLVDREDRMTRAQKTVFELFFKNNMPRPLNKHPDGFDVRPDE